MYNNILRRKLIGTSPTGDDIWTNIGPKDLAFGTMECGFFGEASGVDLITFPALGSLVGWDNYSDPSTGYHPDNMWLKFAWQNKVQFISKTIARTHNTTTYTNLETLKLIFGDTSVQIKGHTFKIRLVAGGDPDIRYIYINNDTHAHNSEWNRLFLPISVGAKAEGGWEGNNPERVGINDVPGRWWGENNPTGYVVTEITASSGSTDSWCQELNYSLPGTAVVRGRRTNINFFSDQWYDYSLTWRPVLELVT